MIDLQALKVHNLLIPQSLAANSTVTAKADISDAGAAMLIVTFGTEANTNASGPTISVLEGDGTNFTTVIANRATEDLTTGKFVVYEINRGNHRAPLGRFVKLSVTTPNATNETITLAAIIVEGQLAISPSATADRLGADAAAATGVFVQVT